MDRIPETPDAIDAAWLTAALSERYPGVRVEDAAVEEHREITHSHARLRVRYHEPAGAAERMFCMLNALWFDGEAGAAHYAEYAAAAAPFVEKYGGRLVASYAPELALIGTWNPDLFFVVEWSSWESFQRRPADPGYQAIAPRRSLRVFRRGVGRHAAARAGVTACRLSS